MSYIDDDPSYNFKPNDYIPTIGDNQDISTDVNNTTLGYFDEVGLRDLLAQIHKITDATIIGSENDLEKFTLKIDPGTQLERAQTQEWPEQLGQPKQFITYQQYKALEKKQTRGSEYIRSAYEDNVRGTLGTNAMDTLIISRAIKREATNIGDFLNDYLGDVNDSSEYRILELLQDWAQSGLQNANNFANLLIKRIEDQVQIPTSEMDQITETAAKSYQAFFQTKVNAVNVEIKQLTTDLEKEHNVMSEIFYKKFLGPSLNFRLRVSRPLETEASAPTLLAAQANQADKALGANFVNMLTDQMKRNENFDNAMDNIRLRVKVRDTYAGFTQQLDSVLQEKSPTPFIKVDLSEDDLQDYSTLTNIVDEKASTENPFLSAHSDLDGIFNDDAHPQYPLKSGDTFTGDIGLADDVKVDGIVPSTHAHTGQDGSVKIKGSDIEGGTLNVNTVDTDDKPAIPTNLKLVSTTITVIPGGSSVIDATISWEGDEKNTFEVQVSKSQAGV